MNEAARTAALEAIHGPHRVYIDGALVRGYWAAEDAHDAAHALAAAGRPATVRKEQSGRKPIAGFLDRL